MACLLASEALGRTGFRGFLHLQGRGTRGPTTRIPRRQDGTASAASPGGPPPKSAAGRSAAAGPAMRWLDRGDGGLSRLGGLKDPGRPRRHRKRPSRCPGIVFPKVTARPGPARDATGPLPGKTGDREPDSDRGRTPTRSSDSRRRRSVARPGRGRAQASTSLQVDRAVTEIAVTATAMTVGHVGRRASS